MTRQRSTLARLPPRRASHWACAGSLILAAKRDPQSPGRRIAGWERVRENSVQRSLSREPSLPRFGRSLRRACFSRRRPMLNTVHFAVAILKYGAIRKHNSSSGLAKPLLSTRICRRRLSRQAKHSTGGPLTLVLSQDPTSHILTVVGHIAERSVMNRASDATDGRATTSVVPVRASASRLSLLERRGGDAPHRPFDFER